MGGMLKRDIEGKGDGQAVVNRMGLVAIRVSWCQAVRGWCWTLVRRRPALTSRVVGRRCPRVVVASWSCRRPVSWPCRRCRVVVIACRCRLTLSSRRYPAR